MANSNPCLEVQGVYRSDVTPQNDYYSFMIIYADNWTGAIEASWGKNQSPQTAMVKSGFKRLPASNESVLNLTFDSNVACTLLSADQTYKKLSGQLYDKQTGILSEVVFHKE
ncbi:hypothetical protein ACUN0G_15435 [Pseudomonas sp. 32A]|jgi:hypothetical protein|uniref:hypothetical protein n=1 Tax=Pseudomonas sp. 32A TaxID=651185 RepID=UPI004046603A